MSKVDWGKWKLVSIALDHFEFETWVDEEIGGGRACDDGSCAKLHCVL